MTTPADAASADAVTSGVPVDAVPLCDGVGAWFTGRPSEAPTVPVGRAGNLSHRRPHRPTDLARDRADASRRMGLAVDDLHWMQQVHGADVGVVAATTVRGAELRGVDALVTSEPRRALVVQVADCIPLLFGSTAGVVGVAHAGRRGLAAGVVPATLAAMERLGAPPDQVSVLLGPAIGGCCYEVPAELQAEVAADHPDAQAETTWGTPSLDLPAAARRQLEDAGVAAVRQWGGCTRCDTDNRWFSHRADADAGRQVGVVVRWDDAGPLA